jgi:DNA-binding response OmpR family regulator
MVNPKKVFYVDNSDFLRKMMEFALKAKGAEIYTIDTLENNLYLLDDLVPDLIIFDVQTAKNHLEILKSYSGKAVLVGTGAESDRSTVSGMVKDFLPKPIEARSLATRILSLLD